MYLIKVHSIPGMIENCKQNELFVPRWFLRGKEVQSGPVFHLNRNLSEEDQGVYTCVAENFHGSKNIEVTIIMNKQ